MAEYHAVWDHTPEAKAKRAAYAATADAKAKKAAKGIEYRARPEVKAAAAARSRACDATPTRKAKRAARRSSPRGRLEHCLRGRHHRALRDARAGKALSTRSALGCTGQELLAYIEAQFLPGMTWANHGIRGWHLDHRRPLASFDLSDPEQQRAAFHFTNLQPMWSAENLRKSARYDPAAATPRQVPLVVLPAPRRHDS